MSEFVSVYDFAQMAGCSTRTVLRLIRRGALLATRHPKGRKYWIDREHASRYLADRKTKAAQAARALRAREQLQMEFFDQLL